MLKYISPFWQITYESFTNFDTYVPYSVVFAGGGDGVVKRVPYTSCYIIVLGFRHTDKYVIEKTDY